MAAAQDCRNGWLANRRRNLRDFYHRTTGPDSLLGWPDCLRRADHGHRGGGVADVPSRAPSRTGGFSQRAIRKHGGPEVCRTAVLRQGKKSLQTDFSAPILLFALDVALQVFGTSFSSGLITMPSILFVHGIGEYHGAGFRVHYRNAGLIVGMDIVLKRDLGPAGLLMLRAARDDEVRDVAVRHYGHLDLLFLKCGGEIVFKAVHGLDINLGPGRQI